MKTDGSFWLADHASKDGRYVWLPIKPAACPSASDRRFSIYVSTDPVYGAYRCVYPIRGDHRNATPVIGARRQRIWRYIGTHKLLLATDTVLILSSLADSASSYKCEQTSTFCSEDNPLLPKHPTAAQLYSLKLGMTAGFITLNHWWYHAGSDWGYELWTAPLVFSNISAAKHNVDLAEKLSSAQRTERKRLRSDSHQRSLP